jgi:hypothetical protein
MRAGERKCSSSVDTGYTNSPDFCLSLPHRQLCSGAPILLLSVRIIKVRGKRLSPQGPVGGDRPKTRWAKRRRQAEGAAESGELRKGTALKATACSVGKAGERGPSSAETHPPFLQSLSEIGAR